MAVDSQTPQESGVKGRVNCTPLQGSEYAKRCAGVPPTAKYNNLEEWFQDVSIGHPFRGKPFGVRYLMVILINGSFVLLFVFFQQNFGQEIIGETENVEVVRTFYTYRPNPRSGVEIWYADGEFGFFEGLPKRVADLLATHVVVEVRNPKPLESILRISDSRLFIFSCDFLLPA